MKYKIAIISFIILIIIIAIGVVNIIFDKVDESPQLNKDPINIIEDFKENSSESNPGKLISKEKVLPLEKIASTPNEKDLSKSKSRNPETKLDVKNKIQVKATFELGLDQNILLKNSDGETLSNLQFEAYVLIKDKNNRGYEPHHLPNVNSDNKGYINKTQLPKNTIMAFFILDGYAGLFYQDSKSKKETVLVFKKSAPVTINFKFKDNTFVNGARLRANLKPYQHRFLINAALDNALRKNNPSVTTILFFPLLPIDLTATHKKLMPTEKQTILLESNKSEKLEFTFKEKAYIFKLNFINKKLNELPLKCDIIFDDKRFYRHITRPISRKKGHSFELIRKSQRYKIFNLFFKDVGYANKIKIPFLKSNHINILLKRGGSIKGKVISVTGKGLSNVTIALEGEINLKYGNREDSIFPTTTDQDGNFKIGTIPPKGYQIIAEHNDFASAKQRIVITDESVSNVNIIMKSGYIIKGILYAPDRTIVSNAKVIMRGLKQNSKKKESITNELGLFYFSGLENGNYILGAQIKNIGHANGKEIVIKDASVEDCALVLDTSLQIKGKLALKNGDTPKNVRLYITQQS